MHPVLSKRIQIPWKCLTKGAAGFLSLPSWVFIVGTVLFWNRIGLEDNLVHFWISAGICWSSSSVAFLLFVRLQDEPADAKLSRFWFVCSGFPIALVPLLVGVNLVYGVLYGVTHLAGMHDSL